MVLVMVEIPITTHGRPNKTRIRVVTMGLDPVPDDRPTWEAGQYKWHLRDEVHQWFLDMNIPYHLVVSPDLSQFDRDTFKVAVDPKHEVMVRLRWSGCA